MSVTTKRKWTATTWNPVLGCTRANLDSKESYPDQLMEQFRKARGNAFEQHFDCCLISKNLEAPLNWDKPRKIYVNSTIDLFHEGVPVDVIRKICQVMEWAYWHQFQVSTKWSERMRDLLNGALWQYAGVENIWWGVKIEDRDYGVPKIGHLREIRNAQLRWLEIEPLMEDLGRLPLEGILWVVVGGEIRPMQKGWVHRIRIQCEEKGIPFFFKRLGSKTGRKLDGRRYDENPKVKWSESPPRWLRMQVVKGFEG